MTRNFLPTFFDESDPFEILFKDFFKSGSNFSTACSAAFNYPVDVYNTKEGTTIEIAAAGLDKEDINITYEDEILRVTYKKEETTESTEDANKEDVNVIHRGIARRSFDQAWKLGRKYDVDGIKTKLDKGILTITIPYKADSDTRTFTIE